MRLGEELDSNQLTLAGVADARAAAARNMRMSFERACLLAAQGCENFIIVVINA